MAEVVRDQRPGAKRCQQRYGKMHARLPEPRREPASFLGQLAALAGRKPLVKLPHAPDDKQHRKKRQLE